MSSRDDNVGEKKPEAAPPDEAALVSPNEQAPPPPANIHVPSTSVKVAIVQNPQTLLHLPLHLQQRVFDGLDTDSARQFELAKLHLEVNERAQVAMMSERQEGRRQDLGERSDVRKMLVGIGAAIGAVGTGIYVYLLATGRDAFAQAFFQDCLKVIAGALGGSGATAWYKGTRRGP